MTLGRPSDAAGPRLAGGGRPDRRTRRRCSTDDQVTGVRRASSSPRADLDGRSVCVLVPDGTRTCPLPLLLRAVHAALHGRVTRMTVLVALGTHARDERRGAGRPPRLPPGAFAETYPGTTVVNHEWWDPDDVRRPRHHPAPPGSPSCPRAGCRRSTCGSTGRSSSTTSRWSSGRCFPHEVVGISGGNKYFFPGVAGQEIIDVSHWLGALITSAPRSSAPRHHPGPRADRRGRVADPGGQAGVLRRGQSRGPAPCTRSRSATPSAPWAAAAEVCRRDPRPLPRRPGPPGAVARPGHVRRHLDRRQGLLQAGAGRRRRRRGHPLRPAHHPRSPPCTRRSTRSATTAATTS